jgi:serine/threonine protein kinase
LDDPPMNAQRWLQIESLYQSTRDLEPNERDALLAEACAGDDELRREVESLLRNNSTADRFRTGIAYQLAADGIKGSDPSMIGVEIGSFKILSLLGTGGMGKVYRAKDLNLGRDVAIKVLPTSVAHDPDCSRRFEREARLLATLNHPHIAAIYGFEKSNDTSALVLELVEGTTLAERVAKGPLPVVEALRHALEIAEALEAAHEKGIIHRDLKPANIKVTPGGTVKVLDFGLAKAFGSNGSSQALSELPTVTIDGTHEGVIAGTPSYMSPEQARGSPVDKRTDIWAFGCVLFEMLTGRKAFDGKTISDAIAAVLKHEPEWNALPASTPAAIRRLLHRCLDKDPRRRLRDIGDAVLEIDNHRI